MCETLCNIVYCVGLYTLAVVLYDHLKSPVILLLAAWRGKNKINLRERFGEWAVVTGSTDGIGKAYARELARRGVNIVLISRTESKLQAVAKDIENDFKVRTKIIVADLSKAQSEYDHIEKELGNLRVGIVVNNVGMNTSVPSYVACAPIEEVWQQINTNMGSMTHMCHLFLRRMRADGIKGIIVNVSSFMELNPYPCTTIYAATKAYARSFTLGLQHEARPWGVTVQLLSPFFVATKLIAPIKLIAGGNFMVPQADVYARASVDKLGLVDQTNGFFWHAIMYVILKSLPWQLRAWVGKQLLLTLVPEIKTD